MPHNEQIISKSADDNTLTLDIQSIFLTFQGEGPYSGEAAVFIRLAGCNLQCPQCDTNYSDPLITCSPRHILDRIQEIKRGATLAVITGGEPFRQNIGGLVKGLKLLGMKVQIETNGTLAPTNPDFLRDTTVICSPKTGSVAPKLHRWISHYKYPVGTELNLKDGLPRTVLGHSAKPCVARPHEGFVGHVYLYPADEGNEFSQKISMQLITDSVLRFGYIAQLQVHKYYGVS